MKAYAPKPKIPPPPKRENLAKDSICHEASRKLKPRALSLYVGNGQREAIEAIGIFYLCLPSRLEIVLNNCHYAPSITRGVICVSCLYEDGFVNRFVDNTIHVSRNNVVYFCAIPRDGIFEIDLSNSLTNESSVYEVSNKRAKLDLDSTLLCHCRFEKYVSCMFGKMARKPYTHQVERAKDLLGLIYTDVCGPFTIMSRQGASCFVTFTDDFNRYSYIYLLKHKHEVFETFKVFQKEVENQLGKTIKLLCSDRGGEYMSQEFLDHLKDHGIIAHRTPPYTSQHNGVSERRNRTILDMVQSMMSQTTLLKSFWDYALETAARILNMVPTKKVEKTPYEVWHGKVPKLSYLKVWGCEGLVKRDTLTKPDKLEPISIKCIFRKSLIDQEASGSLKDLKIIQEEDTHLFLDTSLNHEEEDLYIDEPQKMQSIKDNEVWVLVELPRNGKTVGSKWLFKKKTDMDGNVHIYKAHLVAKGFTQTLGNDYEETFSLVADIRAIRILIAIAAYYDYEICGYIPMQEKLKLSKTQGASTPGEMKRMQNVRYASAVGSIMYDVRCTRPDVTGDLKQELRVSYYTNTGYLTDDDDLKSQTGYVFVLNGGAVDWKSAKQSIFATSSAKAKYIAAFDVLKKPYGLENSFLG
nr:retrotransposon protein, putative, Ty1-copia subclass [Tanacetum cinerariifolium]